MTVQYRWYKDRSLLAVLLIEDFAAYASAVNSISAPYLADDFGLSQAAVAAMFGMFSLGLLGTLYLSRLGDVIGRRRLVLIALLVLLLVSCANIYVTDYRLFVLLQITLYFSGGTLIAACPVIITEHVPEEHRSKAQAIAAMMGFGGAGSTILLMPLFAGTSATWRWHWILMAATLPIVIGYAWYHLAETNRFLSQEANVDRARWRALFKARYTLPLLASGFIWALSLTAGVTYMYYFLVSARGVSPLTVSTVFMLAGVLAYSGLVLGTYGSDRLGRLRCTIVASVGAAGAIFAFYLNWAEGTLFLALTFLACLLQLTAGNARGVATRILTTELYPTHLRSTFAGLAGTVTALAVVAAHFCAAALTELTGSISLSILLMTLLSIPATLLLILVPESRGREMDAADWHHQGVRLIDELRGTGGAPG